MGVARTQSGASTGASGYRYPILLYSLRSNEYFYLTGEPCKYGLFSVVCTLADGSRSKITNSVKFHLKLLKFSWEHEFSVLDAGPFPVILGLDFLTRIQLVIDVFLKRFSFRFGPGCVAEFFGGSATPSRDLFLQSLVEGILKKPKEGSGVTIRAEFPKVFSTVPGTANCIPYVIELTDSTPVRSAPYRYAPPKLAIFRRMVNELLEQGVVRPSKSPYSRPAFLVPKSGGDNRIEVDYRKVNSKILCDSYLMHTTEEALAQFGNAKIFSVFDLNSAYYQIPLSSDSRRVTAVCTPFGLYEFNKLPMGITVESQGLSRVVDEGFADLKGRFVFNFLDDLVVYSSSSEEHVAHVREVLTRLERTGFTLNTDKVVLGASEIKCLGHLISRRGVKILPERVIAIEDYPNPII